MSTITFDTHELVSKLRAAGFDERQAETVIRVVVEAQSGLVTTAHFDAKIDLIRLENSHTRWMLGVVLGLAIANFAKQFF